MTLLKVTRRRKDYSCLDMIRLEMSWYKKTKTPEEIAHALDNLRYMARITEMSPIMGRSFVETFINIDVFTCDRLEINKLIASLANHAMDNKCSKQLAILDNLKDNPILKVDISSLKYDLKEARNVIANYITDITNWQQCIDDAYIILATTINTEERLALEIEASNEDSINKELYTNIQKVIAKDEFFFLGLGDGTSYVKLYNKDEDTPSSGDNTRKDVMYFLSKKQVICTHNNMSAGISQNVNFGNVLIGLTANGTVTMCRFVLNFIQNRDIQHPHLNNNSLCWGSGSASYKKLRMASNPDISSILTLIKQLLETYSPSNPYRKLSSFKHTRKHICALPDIFISRLAKGQVDEYMFKSARYSLIIDKRKRQLKDMTPNYKHYTRMSSIDDKYYTDENIKKVQQITTDILLQENIQKTLDIFRNTYFNETTELPNTGIIPTMQEYINIIKSQGIALLTKEQLELFPNSFHLLFRNSDLCYNLYQKRYGIQRDIAMFLLASYIEIYGAVDIYRSNVTINITKDSIVEYYSTLHPEYRWARNTSIFPVENSTEKGIKKLYIENKIKQLTDELASIIKGD